MSEVNLRKQVSAVAVIIAASVLGAAPGFAQDASHDAMDHSNMNHGTGASQGSRNAMDGMQMDASPFGEGSGTSRLPGDDRPMHGLHLMSGDWKLMAHATIAAQFTDMSGPRGSDKLYSTSMGMLSAERPSDWGRIQLKSMFSLEPTMSDRGYPSLFSTGETAGGVALVDRQHPHDLFMELAARIDVNVATGTTTFVYAGPVGEPALGPSAFIHRGSSASNPDPPIAHHWFDSTHISYGVVTAGISARQWQLEASAFRGEEPDEDRWDIERPRLDSWTMRATLTPANSWALQASYGALHQPEAQHPGQDEHRFTASVHYAFHNLAAMAAFSSKDRVPGDTFTAWLAELNWDLSRRDSLFGRIENVANDELLPDHADPLHDRAFRVTRLQLGYARHIALTRVVGLTLGASGSAYAKPHSLDAVYGNSPFGYTLFARFSLVSPGS